MICGMIFIELLTLSRRFFFKKQSGDISEEEKQKRFLEFHLKLEIALEEQRERYERLYKSRLTKLISYKLCKNFKFQIHNLQTVSNLSKSYLIQIKSRKKRKE